MGRSFNRLDDVVALPGSPGIPVYCIFSSPFWGCFWSQQATRAMLLWRIPSLFLDPKCLQVKSLGGGLKPVPGRVLDRNSRPPCLGWAHPKALVTIQSPPGAGGHHTMELNSLTILEPRGLHQGAGQEEAPSEGSRRPSAPHLSRCFWDCQKSSSVFDLQTHSSSLHLWLHEGFSCVCVISCS